MTSPIRMPFGFIPEYARYHPAFPTHMLSGMAGNVLGFQQQQQHNQQQQQQQHQQQQSPSITSPPQQAQQELPLATPSPQQMNLNLLSTHQRDTLMPRRSLSTGQYHWYPHFA